MPDTTPPVLNVPAGVSAPQPTTAPPAPSPAPAGTLGPQAPESPGKTPRRGSARGIPAAPTALAALNATATAGAAASHAFGPAGGALAAGAALLAATAIGTGSAKSAARKAARSASVRAARSTGSSLGGSRSGSRRTGGGGGLFSPSKRSGPTIASGRSGSGLHRLGSTSGPIGSGGKHRRSGPKSGSAGAGSAGVRPGSGGSTRSPKAGSSPIGARSGSGRGGSSLGKSGSTTRAGSSGGGSRRTSRTPGSTSLATRAARALVKRSDGSRRQPVKASKNAARAVGTAAKAVGRGTKKVWNSRPGRAMRKASTTAGRQGWRVARTLGAGIWAAIGRKGLRGILRAMKIAWDRKKTTGAPAPVPGIPGSKVTMPTTLVGGTASGTAPAPTGGGFSMSQARFLEAAAEMLGAAMVYRPDGMMQVGNDFARMPEAFRNIAGAMQTMAQRAHDEDPIHPAIVDMMGQMYNKLQEVAKMAEDLGPAFKSLHAVDIARIESPRRGEEKWDISRNRDHAGSGATAAPSHGYGRPTP